MRSKKPSRVDLILAAQRRVDNAIARSGVYHNGVISLFHGA